jgi:hypothetical protein
MMRHVRELNSQQLGVLCRNERAAKNEQRRHVESRFWLEIIQNPR